MITSTNLNALRNLEHFQVMSNVLSYLKEENLEELKLSAFAESFEKQLKVYDEVLVLDRGNVLSLKLTDADKKRDDAYRALAGIYTTSLSILPPPSPIIESKSANSTTPNSTTPKERQANPSILAQIPISSSPKELKATQIFKKYNSAVFMIFTKDATNEYQGSGFFISEDGLAISNYHVFKGTHIGAEIIELYNGKQYKVKEVLAYSERYDYILFRIEGKFNYIPITQREYEVGEKVYAIGSPKGMENTFSSGEISQIRGNAIIQISVPIDHGSSGGALINSYGEVIGITSGGDDGSGANLNYAIDIIIIFNTKFKNEDY